MKKTKIQVSGNPQGLEKNFSHFCPDLQFKGSIFYLTKIVRKVSFKYTYRIVVEARLGCMNTKVEKKPVSGTSFCCCVYLRNDFVFRIFS